MTPQWSWNNTPNRGSGPNTPWWEAMEAQQAAGLVVNPPIVTMNPLVESPVTTMSPLVEITEPTPSPLVEDQHKGPLVPADSIDSVATSGIDSPVVPFDEGLTGEGGDSSHNTPKLKFLVGSSSGFCTPCDSAGQSPNPMYTQFIQQISYQPESNTDKELVSASPKTPTREESLASLLRVQSAPGLLETSPYRHKGVHHVGTAPGLLETVFCTDSCDSDCCSSSSQDSDGHKQPSETLNGVPSPRDKVTSSQPEVETESGAYIRDESEDATLNEAGNSPPTGSTNTYSTSRDLVSEPEVSSSTDLQHSHQEQEQ